MSEQQHDADVPADGPGREDVEAEGAGEAPPEHDLSAAAPSEVEHTGNPVVDSVLDSLRELDHLPPAEHVKVFEAAHDRLRGALADAGEPPSES